MNESKIHVIGPRDPHDDRWRTAINTTSNGGEWADLSPFNLGPVTLSDGRQALVMENGWQYAKVYRRYAGKDGEPIPEYWKWSGRGMSNPRAVRYPMGRGATPLYSLLGGEHLDYVRARRWIYIPLYRNSVRKTESWRELKDRFRARGEITLWDFDGYNRGNKTLREVLNDPTRKMGHAFVLAMMLAYGDDFDWTELP